MHCIFYVCNEKSVITSIEYQNWKKKLTVIMGYYAIETVCVAGLSIQIEVEICHCDFKGFVLWIHYPPTGCHFVDNNLKYIFLNGSVLMSYKFWLNCISSKPSLQMPVMTSSNGNICRVTGLLCGNSPVTGEFPSQRPVTRSFEDFFDLHLNKRLSKQLRCWWFEMPLCSLWHDCYDHHHQERKLYLLCQLLTNFEVTKLL